MVNEAKIAANWAEAENWTENMSRGHTRARALVEQLVAEQNPLLFGSTLKAMILRGEFGGEEAGFAQEIAEQFIKGDWSERKKAAS